MNDRRLSKAEWVAMCTALSGVPSKRFNIGALMRSSSDHVIREPMLTIRYKTTSNRDRLIIELADEDCRRQVSRVMQDHTGLHLMVKPELLMTKDYFVRAIHEIMEANGIPESDSSTLYEVSPSAGFREVTQYTDWYVAGRGDTEPPYRFNRYTRVLHQASNLIQLTGNSAVVHIDVGSGPGVFSWAFLDWAREKRIEYSRIRLYGYDHCEQMIVLASQVRSKLREVIDDYPPLNLQSNIQSLLSAIQPNASGAVTYILTFGHVLAGNHLQSDIAEYVAVIEHVIGLRNQTAPLPLVLSDVTSTSDSRFGEGLTSLRSALARVGIHSQARHVTTYDGDRYLLLSRQEV